MNRIALILTMVTIFVTTNIKAENNYPVKPKLVVGIVVDQMRYDYIYKYWNKFGKGGFKRLVNQGYFCENTHYTYVPTYTAPGHTSIYTGATPSQHGIIANDWYAREKGKSIYCTEDNTVTSVGGSEKAGKMSPRNMLTTTISDEIHLSQLNKSKVIGVALKDRGSILPAGHSANAAYWYDGGTGNWITSTYYMNVLPKWASDFNEQKKAESYLAQNWETLLPIDQYTESNKDNTAYEEKYKGEDAPIFPHKLKELQKENGGLGLIRATPFGNSLTKDFAISALKNEQLGKSSYTDVLTISFSSTDYVGHQFGTNAIETEDTYLRLDKDLEELLKVLDTEIGKNNILLFLTADHGAVPVPQELIDTKIPAGYFDGDILEESINKLLKQKYGVADLVEEDVNDQIYLNLNAIQTNNLDQSKIEDDVVTFLVKQNGIKTAIKSTDLVKEATTNYTNQLLNNGYNIKRSGNILYTFEPGWLSYRHTGTSHGTNYTYDTHIPLIFWGKVKSKKDHTSYTITQIAATVAAYMGIEKPNGCIVSPIMEVIK